MMEPSAEISGFSEALLWFLSKKVVTKAEFETLSGEAKRKAFTVAGVARIDAIHDIWKAITRSTQNGEGLGAFRKSVGDKLRAAWGDSVANPGWRIETIYRTNVISAHAAGRWKQMTHPALRKTRPFGIFDAIMDNRVSHTCEQLDGTVLPIEEFATRGLVPPLHFCCRSAIRSLRKSQAVEQDRYGEEPPDVAAQDGFGLPPEQAEWKPDASKYAPELGKILEEKLASLPKWEPAPALKPKAKGANEGKQGQVIPKPSEPIAKAAPKAKPQPIPAPKAPKAKPKAQDDTVPVSPAVKGKAGQTIPKRT